MHLGHEFVPKHDKCNPGTKHPMVMYCETQLGLLHEQATEAEAKRWFERLELLPVVIDQDGSGTDTGDSLDVIEAEVNMATGKLMDALEELVSAVEDGLKRHAAGDPNAIASSMIRATLAQAKELTDKCD